MSRFGATVFHSFSVRLETFSRRAASLCDRSFLLRQSYSCSLKVCLEAADEEPGAKSSGFSATRATKSSKSRSEPAFASRGGFGNVAQAAGMEKELPKRDLSSHFRVGISP